jgi:anti-sigma factor RsiW
MHAVVMESLEDYLSGSLDAAARQRIEGHLNQCEACREEMAAMEDVSLMFAGLRSDEAIEPAPGFYARVMQRVETQKPASSWAALFAFDLAFGRRLAVASLVVMMALGSYLVSRETRYSAALSPETVMAQQDSPSFGSVPGHDAMLVTLTAYEH